MIARWHNSVVIFRPTWKIWQSNKMMQNNKLLRLTTSHLEFSLQFTIHNLQRLAMTGSQYSKGINSEGRRIHGTCLPLSIWKSKIWSFHPKMDSVILVHPEETLTVLALQAIIKCNLYQKNSTLTAVPYRLQSPATLSVFREFVKADVSRCFAPITVGLSL
jgi:hypothetical protein